MGEIGHKGRITVLGCQPCSRSFLINVRNHKASSLRAVCRVSARTVAIVVGTEAYHSPTVSS